MHVPLWDRVLPSLFFPLCKYMKITFGHSCFSIHSGIDPGLLAPVTPAASLLFVAWAHVGTVSVLCFWHSFWLILQQFSDFSHLKDNSRTLLGDTERRG